MKRKILSLLFALAMVLSLLPLNVLAAETPSYSDISGHWAEDAIKAWSALGVIQGSDGAFRPDDSITRGELAVMVDRIMKYQSAAQNSFTDLGQAFYTDAVLKANYAGILKGDGRTVRPAADITREEAVTVLGRALGLRESTGSMGFSDSASVSSWAAGFVNTAVKRGIIQGYDSKFSPKAPITRAQVVTILNNAISAIHSTAGEYTASAAGAVIINTPNVTLKNVNISGDLIIAEGVGTGDVTLNNVTVTGKTIIRGGGENSIRIIGSSQIDSIIIQKTDAGSIRVVTGGGAVVETVFIDDGKDDVILTGSFQDVTVAANVPVSAVGASIANVNVTGAGASVTVDSTSKVTAVTVASTAAKAEITVKGEVGSLTANAEITVKNQGTITKADIKADHVVIDGNKPAEVVVDRSVTEPPKSSDGKPVEGGGSPSSGGGGGIIAPTYDYKVSVGSFTGGTVESSVTQTNTAETEVSLTVTPNAQNGAALPYVLKALTVIGPKGEVTVSDNKFTMSDKGTYTVTAEFVQPLTAAEVFLVRDADSLAKAEEYGYTYADGHEEEILAAAPWLFIGIKRGEDYEEKLALSGLNIAASGAAVTQPANWEDISIGKYASAYVGKAPDHDSDGDALGLTGSGYLFVVSFTYQGAEYSFTCNYVAPGVAEEDLYTVSFGSASYQAVEGEEVTAPTPPEVTGKKFKAWKTGDSTYVKACEEYAVSGESKTIAFTAEYVTIDAQSVAVRRDDETGDYKSTYAAAGVTFQGDTFTVDQKALLAYLTDEENEAKIGVISHNEIPYMGFEFPTPDVDGISKMALTGTRYEDEHTFDLTEASNSNNGDVMDTEEGFVFVDYISVSDQDGAVADDAAFTFDMDWMNEDGLLLAATTVTIQRVTTPAVYTVTYAKEDGDVLKEIEVGYKGKADGAPDVTRPGYTLVGWRKTDSENLWDFGTDTVTEDITLYPVWASAAAFGNIPEDELANSFPEEPWGNVPEADELEFVLDGEKDNTIIVTGILNFVEEWKEFNKTVEAEQSGYYAFVRLSDIPSDAVQEGTIITLNPNDYSKKKTAAYAHLDDSGEDKVLDLVIWVAPADAEKVEKQLQIEVDWDGAEGSVKPTTYTLDFTGLSLRKDVSEEEDFMDLPEGMEIESTYLTIAAGVKTYNIKLAGEVDSGLGELAESVFVTGSFKEGNELVTYAVLKNLESDGVTIKQKNPALFLYDPDKMEDNIKERDSEDTIYKEKTYSDSGDYQFMLVSGGNVTIEVTSGEKTTEVYHITNGVTINEAEG